MKLCFQGERNYLAHGDECDGVGGLGEGVNTRSVQCRRSDLSFSSITALNFVIAAREDNEALLVFL